MTHRNQDDQWREIAVYRGTIAVGSTPGTVESTPKERTIYHQAGLDGRGGSSYIDLVAVRDRDINATGGWDGAADGTMEEQRFYLQNWRADVVGLMRPDGIMPTQVKYSAYGKHRSIMRADVDDGTSGGKRDDGVTTDDLVYYLGEYEGTAGANPCDINDDGGVTIEDLLIFLELNEAGGPALDSRVMYAGYQYSARTGLYHVRHRVYSPELGVWTRQDPVGYLEGPNAYLYVKSASIQLQDPYGLFAECGSKQRSCGLRVPALPVAGAPASPFPAERRQSPNPGFPFPANPQPLPIPVLTPPVAPNGPCMSFTPIGITPVQSCMACCDVRAFDCIAEADKNYRSCAKTWEAVMKWCAGSCYKTCDAGGGTAYCDARCLACEYGLKELGKLTRCKTVRQIEKGRCEGQRGVCYWSCVFDPSTCNATPLDPFNIPYD